VRKRALGTRRPMAVPQAANDRWSLDFISDALTDGRRFRVLAVGDVSKRECLALVADTSLAGASWTWSSLYEGAREPSSVTMGQSSPRRQSCHGASGPPLPGTTSHRESPSQNGFIESFSGRFRTRLLGSLLVEKGD
jgi:putative transposase